MTTATDVPLAQLDQSVANLCAKLADYASQIADLTAQAESLKAELRVMCAPGDYADPAGLPMLRITTQRRFDVDAAAALVPEDQRRECFSVAWDAAKVRGHLTPLQVEACMVESGKPKVALL